MRYMQIERIVNSTGVGYYIKDSVTAIGVSYYGYTLENAIKRHRKNFNLKGVRFERFML